MDAFDTGGDGLGLDGDLDDPAMEAQRQAAIAAAAGKPPGDQFKPGDQGGNDDDEE